MKAALRVTAFVVSVFPAGGQGQSDTAEILRRVSETYRGVTQYEFGIETGPIAGVPAHALHVTVN